MEQRETAMLQHGIWIDQQRLAEAGLHAPLEIAVQSGEIRIRSAVAERSADPVPGEPLLDLAGVLSGSPLSGAEIQRELYPDGMPQK
ncbi:MAG: hypothetical protein RBS80_25090 [Thermoguttaceae bacterium]|jgi:hypothetical protein|nr:hypothetical protein [Thermoguttaceae bacterium]